jgi:hypothetical protein
MKNKTYFVLTLLILVIFTQCKKTTTDPSSCIDVAKQHQFIGVMCVETVSPVCGCDGVTYSNSCYAEKAGVSSYKTGTCPSGQSCKDTSSTPINYLCVKTEDPVCGCDGVTYKNACYAKMARVLSYTPGPCGVK